MEATRTFGEYLRRACLIVVSRPVLALSVAPRWPIKKILLDGEEYQEIRHGRDFSFFYDWLRDKRQAVIGIRCYPDPDPVRFVEAARALPYARVVREELEIYFSAERDIDADNSCDQDFLYTELLQSDNKDMILLFAIDAFTPEEWGGFQAVAEKWVSCLVEYDYDAE